MGKLCPQRFSDHCNYTEILFDFCWSLFDLEVIVEKRDHIELWFNGSENPFRSLKIAFAINDAVILGRKIRIKNSLVLQVL